MSSKTVSIKEYGKLKALLSHSKTVINKAIHDYEKLINLVSKPLMDHSTLTRIRDHLKKLKEEEKKIKKTLANKTMRRRGRKNNKKPPENKTRKFGRFTVFDRDSSSPSMSEGEDVGVSPSMGATEEKGSSSPEPVLSNVSPPSENDFDAVEAPLIEASPEKDSDDGEEEGEKKDGDEEGEKKDSQKDGKDEDSQKDGEEEELPLERITSINEDSDTSPSDITPGDRFDQPQFG